jgi:hypothetical protein
MLMKTTHSMQTVAIGFEHDAIKRSSMKYRKRDLGGFPDRVESILDIQHGIFSSFTQFPIIESSHSQLVSIEQNRQLSFDSMMHEMQSFRLFIGMLGRFNPADE